MGLTPRNRRSLVRCLLAFVLNAVSVSWLGAADALPGNGRAIFPGSIKRGSPPGSELSPAAIDPREPMEFMMALKMRNFDELRARIAQGRLVTRAEMEARYFPLEADYLNVVGWLRSQGFIVTQTDPARLGISARGTVAQLAAALQVGFVRRQANGRNFPSAVDAPSLPLSVAAPVLSVNGLQPDIQLRRHSRRLTPQLNAHVTTQGTTAPPFYPREILKAYNGDTLTADGSGQKIGIVIDTFPLDSDLTSFWSQAGVSQSLGNIEKVQVVSGTLPAPGGEETLDVEWASSIAPGAKVRVYASLDLSFVHIDQVFQQIVNELPGQPALKQISISLGLGENFVGSGQLQTDAQYFASMAAAGVTVYVSSGDSGSNEGGQLQVSYFASDVSVAGVGGTRLLLNGNTGAVSSETVWSGSGGGVSSNFSRPSWQVGPGIGLGGNRLVPDVAAVADPNTGGFVVLNGAVYQYGGTSWSAPIWAGISARINQGRIAAAMPALGLLGPKVYPLIGTTSFRDITSGSNGAYNAAAGHDVCTGIGVPQVANLYTALTTPSTQPNLQPAQPSGWGNIIVTSKATGTNTDDVLTPADTVYVDFGLANVGGGSTSGTFTTELYVDNVLKATFPTSTPVAVNGFVTVFDQTIGQLALGVHSLRIKVDSGNAITESSEADNEFTRTITIVPPSLFDSYSSATLTSAANTPHTFIGEPITLNSNGGTSNISIAGGTAYLQPLTTTSYTNIRLNVTFWGAASGATAGTTPAFSNSLGTYSFDLGPLNASALSIYPYSFSLPSTVVFPSRAGGVTLNWQGNTGSGLTSTDNLTSALRFAPAPPVSGAFTVGTPGVFGYYRNASGETDGNFLGSSFRWSADASGNSLPNQGLALQLFGPSSNSAPTIATHPVDATTPVGGSVTFSLTATGYPGPSYQWQRQPAGTTGFTNISEGGSYSLVNTRTLSVTASALAMSGDRFRCVVSNSSGSATSNAAALTVTSGPLITQQPGDAAVTAGQPATLSVAATGNGALTYQWRRDGLPLMGATNPNLAFNPAHVRDGANYDVLVSDSGAVTVSNSATLTVAPTRYPGAMYIDPAFTPMIESIGGMVNAIAVQPDGKLLVAGDRMRVNGSTLRAIARLNVDGSLDSSFDPGFAPNDWIRAVALQPDGKILIGGDFTIVDGVNRGRVARLSANGSLDLGFDTSVGANDWVLAITVAPDGSVVIGGWFTQVNGTARNHLARLSSTGAVLASFDPGAGPNENVSNIVFQGDGKLIISGWFTSYAGTGRPRVARVNSDGSLDPTFTPVTPVGTDEVYALSLQADGRILIGGHNSSTNYLLRRLHPNGSIDNTFNVGSGPTSSVDALALQSDGKILVGGAFGLFNGSSRSRIARLNADGSLDSFVAATSDMFGSVYSIVVMPDGKIAMGGRFLDLSGGALTSIRRFTTSGARDAGFTVATTLPGTVNEMIQQPDGGLLIAGAFNFVNGVARTHTARLLPNGALDTSFASGTGLQTNVQTMVLQPDGKIVYGGLFSSFNGTRIARTQADGSPDNSFAPGSGPNDVITGLALQADGKLLLGGGFTTYAGAARNHLARINANGSLDSTFNPGTGTNGWPVNDPTVQRDGRVLFAGSFSVFNGTGRNGLARVMPDGALDGTFNPSSAGNGFALVLQPDGKVLYAGGRNVQRFLANGDTDPTFVTATTFARESRSTVFEPMTDPFQAPPRRGVGRSSGVTTHIEPQASSTIDIGIVGALFRQPDGRILVGQEINSLSQPPPVGIARLTADGAADTSFSAGNIADARIARFIMLDDGQLFVAGGTFNDGMVQQGGLVRLTYQVAPMIATQPLSQTAALGSHAVFSVVGTGGGLRYQWFLNNTPIIGATAAKLPVTNVTTANAGSFKVAVSNSVGSVTSSVATLTVTLDFPSWQNSKFTSAELADPGISGPNAVYGLDGLSNLLKYALGLEPKTNVTTGLPGASVAGTDWVFTYARPTSINDVTYAVEVSTDLTTWTSAGVVHESVSTFGGYTTWRGRYPLASAPIAFFRLKIDQP